MTATDFYSMLAHIVLLIHFAFVTFVVLGLLLTWLGYFLRWKFVRNFYSVSYTHKTLPTNREV